MWNGGFFTSVAGEDQVRLQVVSYLEREDQALPKPVLQDVAPAASRSPPTFQRDL